MTRRELERAIDELEAATPAGGEYADPPTLTTERKHELAESLDADVWDPDPDACELVERLHDRYDGDTDR